MKQLYFTFISLCCTLGLNAQNAVHVLNNAQNQTVCDGTAYTDLNLPAPMWTYYWYQDSTLIQTGADTVYNLCPGNYTLTTDSMGTAIASYQFHVYSLEDDTLNGYTEVFYFGGAYGQGNIVFTSGVPPFTSVSEGHTSTDYFPYINDSYVMVIDYGYPGIPSGIHSASASDAAGDTMTFWFAIPDSANWFGSVSDTLFTDTIGGSCSTVCNFNYSMLDSAWMQSVTDLGSNSLVIEWNILSGSTVTTVFDTIAYDSLNGGNFLCVISMYCPTKSTNNIVGVYGQLFKDDSGVHLGLPEKQKIQPVFGPNPFSDFVHLNVGARPSSVRIADTNGNLVESFENLQGKVELDLRHLKNGIYLMEVSNQDGVTTIKLRK